MTENYDFLGMTPVQVYNKGVWDSLRTIDAWIDAVEMTNGDPAKIHAMKKVREQIAKLWRVA